MPVAMRKDQFCREVNNEAVDCCTENLREEGKRRDGDDDDRRRREEGKRRDGDDDRRRGDDDRRGGEEEKMEYPDGMFPCKDYQCPAAIMAIAPIGCGPTPMVQ